MSVFLAFLVLLLTFSVYCEKEGVFDPTPVKPGEYFFIKDLAASPNVLAPGGAKATVSFRLVDIDGKAAAGQRVSLATDRGALSSTVTVTDSDGRAEVVFSSGADPGKATIRASIGEASQSVEIFIGVSTYALTADRLSILADGRDFTVVTATVVDAAKRPLRGAAVGFTATLGTLSQTVVVTDSLGRASTRLTSLISSVDVFSDVSASIDTGSVRAAPKVVGLSGRRASGMRGFERELVVPSAKYTEEITRTLRVQLRGISIEMNSSRERLPADGVSTATITAILRETTSNAAVVIEPVTMSADKGTIPQEVHTDDSGIATANYTSGTIPGRVTLIAGYGTIADTLEVVLTPLNIALEAVPASIFADGRSTAQIIATLTDSLTNNPIVGAPMLFQTTRGRIAPQERTDEDGRARLLLTSSYVAGDATVEASFGAALKKSVVVEFTALEIRLKASAGMLQADGVDALTVTAMLTDQKERPIADQLIAFAANSGLIGPSALSNSKGEATVTFVAFADTSDSRIQIRAHALGVADTVQVDAMGLSLGVLAEPAVIVADGHTRTTLTAVLKRTSTGEAVVSRQVGFSTNLGTLSSPVGMTNSAGEAVVSLISAQVPGTATVTATYGNELSRRRYVELISAYPGIEMTIEAAPAVIEANGASASQITVLLRDLSNNPVGGIEVGFSSTLGTVAKTATTDEQGRATATLTSERSNGTAIVTATYETVAKSTPVRFDGVEVVLAANPENLIADDRTTSMITATLRDAAGVPIVGVPVRMRAAAISGGQSLLDVTHATDSQGQVSDVLKSASPGAVRVSAEAAGATDTVLVHFTGYDLTVQALPEAFTASVDSVRIVAALRDAEQRAVAGANVSFSATLGTVRRAASTTDASGNAEAVLTSRDAGEATITVVATLADGQKVSKAVIVLIASAEAQQILLAIEPSIVQVKGGTATVTAYVTDAHGNPVSNAVVGFTYSGARGGAGIDPGIATTNANGLATTVFTSGTIASSQIGDVRIEAGIQGTAVRSNVASLTVAGAPATVTVGFSPPPVAVGDGTFELAIAALVSDINGNPVADGTRVDFGVDRNVGVVGSPIGTVGGKARTKFTYPVSEAGGRIAIHVQAGAVAVTETFVVPGFSGTVAELALTAESSTNVLGNGVEEVAFSVLVTDTEQHPAGDLLVTFVAGEDTTGVKTGPQYLVGAQQVANPDWGIARSTVSKAVYEDLAVTVRALYGDKSSNAVDVTFRGVSVEVVSAKSQIGTNGETSLITVLLKEATNHAPIVGAQLGFGASLGTVSATSITDDRGMAANLLRSGARTGTARVKANYGPELSGTVDVEVIEMEAAGLQVIAEPTEIEANGTSTALITVSLRDQAHNPIADREVVFTSGLGTITASATTDQEGLATALLRSERRNGRAMVVARFGTLSDTVWVSFSGITLELAADPENLFCDLEAKQKSRISATLRDAAGRPIVGERIEFATISAGARLVSGVGVTDENGVAADYLSSSAPGAVEVTGHGAGAIGTRTVTFTNYRLEISASPAAFEAFTGSSTISVTLLDSDEQPLGDVRVDFFTTVGWILPVTGRTDASGTATATLTSRNAGGALVTALAHIELEGGEERVTATRNVSVVSAMPTAILLRVDPGIIAVGSGTSMLSATVTDVHDNPVQGAVVSFNFGGARGGARITPSVASTDSTGIASTVFYSGALASLTAGDAWVEARTVTADGDVVSEPVELTISGAPTDVFLGYNLRLAVDNGDGTYSLPLSALISDVYGNPVADGTRVDFGADWGVVASPVTTRGGKAVTSFSYPAKDAGRTVKIEIQCAGISVVEALAAPGRADDITVADIRIAHASVDLLGNGEDTEVVVASVYDEDGIPVGDLQVTFFVGEDTVGSVKSETQFLAEAFGEVNPDWGKASIAVTSEAVREDRTTELYAEAKGRQSNRVEVRFRGVSLDVDASADAIGTNGETSVITVVLKETSSFSPITDAQLRFGTSLGTIPGTGYTNASGVAVNVLTSGTEPGEARVIVSYGSALSDTVLVAIEDMEAAGIQLFVDPTTIEANGVSTAQVTAALRDRNHNPIADRTVRFTTNLGTIGGWALTDADGRGSVQLTSERRNGMSRVVVTYGSLSDTALVAFTGITLEVRGNPEDLVAGGGRKSVVTAVLRDAANNPIAGEQITLRVEGPGLLDTGVGVTGMDGTVSDSLAGTAPGAVTVIAEGAGATATTLVTFTEYVLELASDVATFQANLDTATLFVQLLDSAEPPQPVAGVKVDFSSTLGRVVPGTVTTDSDGRAQVQLSSGDAGPATVTALAYVDPEARPVSQELTLQIISAPPAAIELRVHPPIVGVHQGTAELTAIVTDENGNPVHGAIISFHFTGARGGARINPGTATTDAIGVARTTFYSGAVASTTLGDVRIVADIHGGGVASKEVGLTIAGAPETVTVGYTTAIKDNGDGSLEMPVTALIADVNGNPVADGTRVDFGVRNTVGVIEGPVPTSRGKASTRFTYPASETGRLIQIKAQAGGVADSIFLMIPGFSGTVADVRIQAQPTSILGDGEASTGITAFVIDSEGNPVGDIVVDFATTAGTIEQTAVTASEWASEGGLNVEWGKARAVLTSQATRDNMPASVTASVGNRSSDPVQVTFRGVSLAATAYPPSIGAGGETSLITAVLKETVSNVPISGAALSFGTSLGTMPGVAHTDGSGVARNVLTSGEAMGDARISITYGRTLTETASVRISEMVAAGLSVDADPTNIQANGESTSRIQVRLRDTNNNPVAGKEVRFWTTLGTIPGAATTDINGRATVLLTSERFNGEALVVASYGALTDSTRVVFTGVQLGVMVNPANLIADGETMSTIRVTLTDAASVPIVDEAVEITARLVDATGETVVGQPVLLGAPSARTDVNGTLTGYVYSDSSGTATLTFRGAGATATADLTFTDHLFGASASPPAFTANEDSSVVTVELRDSGQSPVPGSTVDFSTTLGLIDRTTAVTDAQGRASVTLVSAGAGLATVTAVAHLVDGSTVSIAIDVSIYSSSPASVILSASPTTVQVNGGTATIKALVMDAGYNPVEGATVSFNLLDGPHGGEAVSPATATTDRNGLAATKFTTGFRPSRSPEDVAVKATVMGTTPMVESEVLRLTIAGATEGVYVGYRTPPFDNQDGTYDLSVSAIVSDINGNPVVDGTKVSFTTAPSIGVITSSVTVGGKATTVLTYPANSAGRDIVITAESGGVTGTTGFKLPGSTGVVADITLSAEPGSILGDGVATTTISAHVIDTGDDPVGTGGNPVGGVSVMFDALYGTINGSTEPVSATTNESSPDVGMATVTLRSVASTQTLVDTVWGRVGDRLSVKVPVRYRGVSLSARAFPDTIETGGQTSAITVQVKETDSYVPVVGAELSFGASLGTVPKTAVTNASGVAQAVLESGEEWGQAKVTYTYGLMPEDSVLVYIRAGAEPVSIVLVSVEPKAIGVRGSGDNETAQLRFRVRDEQGRNVPDGTSVSFQLVTEDTTARISPKIAGTAGGLVGTTVTSGIRSGVVKVRATATRYPQASSAAISVVVHGGPPVKEHFSLSVEKYNIEGLLKSGLTDSITAVLYDQHGNPVPEGTAVWFRIMDEVCGNVGGIEGSADTDASGRASVILWSAGPEAPPGGRVFVEAQTMSVGDFAITDTAWVVFSGQTAPITVVPAFIDPELEEQAFEYYVRDFNANPLVAGSRMEVVGEGGTVSRDVDVTIGDWPLAGDGYTRFGCRFRRDAGAEPGTSRITFSVTSPNGDRTETITEQRRTLAQASSVVMSLLDSTLLADGLVADGQTQMRVNAYVYDDSARGLADKTVTFYNSVNTNVVSAMTDAEGKAAMTFETAATGWSSVTITALSDLVQASIAVPLRAVTLTLTPQDAVLTANGHTRTSLYVTLTSELGGIDRPEANRVIHFSSSLGALSALTRTTDGSGQITGLSLGGGTTPGVAEITATLGLTSALTTVSLVPPAPSEIQVTTDRDAILANGTDGATLTAVVKDQEGERLPDAAVRFYASGYPDARFDPEEAQTNGEGVAVSTLSSWPSALDVDVMVTARVDSSQTVAKRDSVEVTLEGVALTLTPGRPRIVANGHDAVEMVAELKSTRRSVAGAEIRFKTDLGTLSSPGATTDQYGFATVSLFSTTDGTASIDAWYIVGVVEDGASVTVDPALPNDLKLEVSPSVMTADNMGRAVVGVVLTNSGDNYTVDGEVAFTSSFVSSHPASGDASRRPQLLNTTVRTVNGRGSIQVLSGYAIGTLSISASTLGGSLVSTPDTVRITYKPGPPIIDYVTIAPTAIQVAQGLDRATIRADGLDRARLSVHVQRPGPFDLKGALVAFEAEMGDVASPVATDEAGLASTYFTCTEAGLAGITVTVTNEAGSDRGLSDFIQVVPGEPATIELSFADDFVGVRGVGRKASTIITAAVSDVYGNPVADSTLVQFEIVDSPSSDPAYNAVYNDGFTSPEPDTLMIGPTRRVPTVGGQAQVAFVSGSRAGVARIKGSVIDSDTGRLVLQGSTTEFQIISGPAYLEQDRSATPAQKMYRAHIALDARVKNLHGFGETTTITAFVGDRYNNPVSEGTSVYFTTTGGIIVAEGGVGNRGRTDRYGMATATLIKTAPFADEAWDGIYRYENFQNLYLTDVIDPNLPAAGGQNTIPPTAASVRDLEFGASPTPHSSYRVQNSIGGYTENDGFVRVMASTRGVDASGDSAIVWAVADVIFSEAVRVFQIAEVAWDDTLGYQQRIFNVSGGVESETTGDPVTLGSSATVTIRCYDENGNPVVPGSTIKASATKGDIKPWEVAASYPYGGNTWYTFRIGNNLEPEDSPEVTTIVTFTLESPNGNATQTLPVTFLNPYYY